MAIPLSPIVGILSYGTKALFQIWTMKQKQKHEEEEWKLKRFGAEQASVEAARANQTEEASIARRFVVMVMTVFLVAAPVILPLFGVSVAVGWHEIEPGFLWIDDQEVVKWRVFGDPLTATVVLIPILFDLYATVVGFYFGGKVGK